MNKLSFFVIILCTPIIFLFNSCKKEAGEGGTSVIRGRIWVRQYDALCSKLQNSYWSYKEKVYIQYGDGVGLNANGKNTDTDNNGYFEFEYLRNGNYKIFIYSADSTSIVGLPRNPNAPKKSVVLNVEITKRKQTIDLGKITILETK